MGIPSYKIRIHTYIHNWPLQPFSQDYGLAAHTIHVVCVKFILSEPFDTVRGFRQGDHLSCDLFNFVMESVMRKALQKSVQLLAYADDIDIIGRTK